MGKKSTALLLLSLGVIAIIVAYAAGLFDWMLDYSSETKGDILDLLGSPISLIALLAYIYFGIRFFNRCVSEQI